MARVYDASLVDELSNEAEILRTGSLDPLRLSMLARGLLGKDGGVRSTTTSGGKSSFSRGRLLTAYRAVRSWVLFPDACFGWLPFAVARGAKAIRGFNIDTIAASVPPYTSAIIARTLSGVTGIPFIVDFRDGWTDDPYLSCPTCLHEWAHRRLESWVIRKASAVCVYGDYLRDCLIRRYPNIESQVAVITNGYDPADFIDVTPAAKRRDRFRIAYCGWLFGYHKPNFTTLLTALKRLPLVIRRRLEILFVGGVGVPGAEAQVSAEHLDECVKFMGYRSHAESVSYLLSADACLFFLPPGDVSSYSGKIFEYFRAGCPIISCLEPEGTCADLLRCMGQERGIVAPRDDVGLTRVLEQVVASGWAPAPREAVQQFSREFLTHKLANVLESTMHVAAAADRKVSSR